MSQFKINDVVFDVSKKGKVLKPQLFTASIDTAVDAAIEHATNTGKTYTLVFNERELTITPNADRQSILDTYFGGPKDHGTFVVEIG